MPGINTSISADDKTATSPIEMPSGNRHKADDVLALGPLRAEILIDGGRRSCLHYQGRYQW